MKVQIMPGSLSGTVRAVASKSHGHRLLIASALSEAPGEVSIHTTSQDIEATGRCLDQLAEEVPVFNCGESGSTLRFLVPLAMALKEEAVFLGKGRLPERPISPLKEEMEGHGCVFSKGEATDGDAVEIFRISGKLTGGTFTLPGNVSSQYVTGLLFALPLLEEDSRIEITTPLESRGYVDLTLDVLKQFRIRVTEEENQGCPVYTIRGRQKYISPGPAAAEGDWSNAAFWVMAGCLSKGEAITCTGLKKYSIQGDREIASIAEAFGATVIQEADTVSVSGGTLKPVKIDASPIPDLVPVIAAAACAVKGTTEIYNAGRLRIKESDRLAAMGDCLKKLGADVTEKEDGLVIRGTGSLKGGNVSGYNDHRIVMAMAVASIICEDPVIIEGAEAVSKSYPDFFRDFESLGGEYRVI